MKSLIKKDKASSAQAQAQCCAPASEEKVAQCCAKQSKVIAGCHD